MKSAQKKIHGWPAIAAIVALSLVCGPAAKAAALETVSLAGGGGTHQGAGAIANAMAAVSDGGEVRIIQAGTYSPIAPPSGKKYSVRASVPGVVIDGGATTAVMLAPVGAPLTVTLENLDMIHSSGTGNAVILQLSDTQATSVSILNSKVRFTELAGGLTECVALRVMPGATVAGATVASQLNVTNTRIELLNPNGETETNASVFANNSTNLQNLTANFTSCTLLSNANAPLAYQGGDNQTWTFNKCWIECTYGPNLVSPAVQRPRAISIRGANSGCTWKFFDTTVKAYGATIGVQGTAGSQNNHWQINRCTFDNRRFALTGFGGLNGNMRFTYTNAVADNNLCEIYNSLILTQTNQTAYVGAANSTLKMAYCTVIPETTAGVGLQTGTFDTVVNTIFVNCTDAMPAAATTGGNLLAGPDDANAGADRIHVADQAALALDANFVPTAGSPAVDAANPNPAYLALINSLDRRGLARTGLPDIGAMELGAGPPVVAPNAAHEWVIFN